MKPACTVVGAMEPGPMVLAPGLVIAADGGLAHLKAQGAAPDLTVGDFDSLGYVPDGNVIRHPPEKDDTDTMLALRLGLERGYDTFVLYGCLGGRMDHAYANFQAVLAEDPAFAFICYVDADYVASTRLKGIAPDTVLGHHGVGIFWNVTQWTLE